MVAIRILSSDYYCQHMRPVFGYSIVVCYQWQTCLVWVPTLADRS